MSLASYITELRDRRGLRATDLAARTGLNRSYISEIERGKIALPNADIRRRLADALGVSHVDILIAAGELSADDVQQAGVVPVEHLAPEVISLIEGIKRIRLTEERRRSIAHVIDLATEIDRRSTGNQGEGTHAIEKPVRALH